MTSQQASLTELSDDQLLLEVRRLAGGERQATAALLRSLIELDVRRLYLREGCSSLFTYCTQVLHLEEGAAYNRIETARAARRFPSILDHIADGSLTLTSARLLAPHLTPDNFSYVLASARHKSKREVELLVASLHPKPAVPESIRRLPPPPSVPLLPSSPSATATDAAPRGSAESSSATVTGSQPTVATDCPRSPAVLAPLTADRYKVQLTISRDTYDKLRRVQDLLRHTIGNADLGELFDRAITSLLTDLERRRCAATGAPRPRPQNTGGSRHIPAGVRRAVWKRDAGQCAFIGTRGVVERQDFSNSTTSNRTQREARLLQRTSNSDVGRTTSTRRGASSPLTTTKWLEKPRRHGPTERPAIPGGPVLVRARSGTSSLEVAEGARRGGAPGRDRARRYDLAALEAGHDRPDLVS